MMLLAAVWFLCSAAPPPALCGAHGELRWRLTDLGPTPNDDGYSDYRRARLDGLARVGPDGQAIWERRPPDWLAAAGIVSGRTDREILAADPCLVSALSAGIIAVLELDGRLIVQGIHGLWILAADSGTVVLDARATPIAAAFVESGG